MEWRNRTDERKNGTEEGVQLFENEHMGERGSKEKNDFYNKFRYLALYINMNNIILWHKCHIKLTFLDPTLPTIFLVLTWSQTLSSRRGLERSRGLEEV